MNYLLIATFLIYLIAGAALLLVWRRNAAQQLFVRDLGWSTMSASLVPIGYLVNQSTNVPLLILGKALLLTGTVANLIFLAAAVTQLAGRQLSRGVIASMAIVLSLLVMVPSRGDILVFGPPVTLLFLLAVGILTIKWMVRKSRVEMLVGPMLLLLALNQVILLVWRDAGVPATAVIAMVLRLGIGLLFLFAALDRSSNAMRKLYARFEMLTEHSHQGVVVTDGTQILYANPAARAIYGRPSTQAMNEAFVARATKAVNRNELVEHHDLLQSGQVDFATWEGPRVRADGVKLQLQFSAWRIDWDGVPATQILITDETARATSARELLYQATHDELTDLPNRHLFMQRLKECCATGACALIVLNIDRFKLFNQHHGHLVGDSVLQIFASTLKTGLADKAELMHLGGDEFAVLIADAYQSRLVALQLHSLCVQPLVVPEGEFFIDASMGMAGFPANAADADTLLRAANAAMYQAKRTPGTFLVLAEKRFEQISSLAFEHEQALRKAIRNHEIYLHFQPKVDSATGSLLGFEALARWNRTGIGQVSPVEFIAVAERTGLIVELGSMLLMDACAQIARWCAEYGDCVPVAVNVSPIQLLNPGFLRLVEQAVRQYKIRPGLLTLEITESAAVDNLEQTQSKLQQLRELGVHVAMDDFGTGFSSLSMLRNLPLHTLKIDRALIDPLPAPDAMAVVRAICQLAKALNLRVVAEGVETIEQVEAARHTGCDELQGYFYAKPLTHESAARWLASR